MSRVDCARDARKPAQPGPPELGTSAGGSSRVINHTRARSFDYRSIRISSPEGDEWRSGRDSNPKGINARQLAFILSPYVLYVCSRCSQTRTSSRVIHHAKARGFDYHSIRDFDLKVEMAERTGLEPATSRVTGERSNQLNYHSAYWLEQEGRFNGKGKL